MVSMKVECPVCSCSGSLQVRGGSRRVIHYSYDASGARIFTRHNITGYSMSMMDTMDTVDTAMETGNLESSLESKKNGGPNVTRTRDLWLVKPTS